jgi:MSHA biogenesis protein MshQ
MQREQQHRAAPLIGVSMKSVFFMLLLMIAMHFSSCAFAQTVSFRSSSQASIQSGNLSIAQPSGTSSGDVMVATIAVRPSSITVTAPSGWTLVRQVVNGSTISLQTYYKVATSSEPSSYTWTMSTAGFVGASGGIVSLIGADTSNPVDAESGQANASSTSQAAPSVTTTQSNSMLVTAHAIASSVTWAAPAGMTEAADTASITPQNSGGVSMEMNYLAVASVSTTGTKTATAASNADVGAGQSIVIKPLGGLTCYTDSFGTNGTPSTDWSVGNVGGTFGNPTVVNHRLRLTDASSTASTYATLQRLFPAFGNKIVVEFYHYSYGGTGADGIGVVLSDASIAPVSGAYGGSLGYAPKRADQGGDTTHVGFAGGWLGIALDEFGNFSANTEGRTGGSAPGITQDSVAIRGSGSGYTGYAYLTGTSTLSPGIDQSGSTAGPGYKYRITVDHSDGVHAMTSVERDTGSGYSYLISPFDAKAQSGQAAVPTNWYLSYTGATGGSTNIHEIANLQVCSYTQKTVSLHHLEIDHDGTACGSDTVTIKACADLNCTALYGGSVTLNFSATGGSGTSLSQSNPITFTGGQTQVTITQSGSATLTLGATATSPSTANSTTCYAGTTSTCTLVFQSTCFDAVEVNASANTPIYTKLAGTAFNLDVLALTGGSTINTSYKGTVNVALVDPNAPSGNCTDTKTSTLTGVTISPATNYTFKGSDSGRHTYSFTSANAASNAKVRIYDTSIGKPVCSSDNFSIRPAQFNLAATDTAGNAFTTLKAGANFTISATPVTTDLANITAGYTGTPVFNSTGVTNHNGETVTVGGSSGNILTGVFNAATGGTASGTFQYNDVGTFSVAANTVVDSSFTAVDQVTGIINGVNHGTSGDCTAGSILNSKSSNVYGCNIGSSNLQSVGRFYPDHYEVNTTITAACNGLNGAFTYMGNDALGIYVDVRAKSANGSTTSQLKPGYSPLPTLTVDGVSGTTTGLLSRLSNPSFPAVAWQGGSGAGGQVGGAFTVQSTTSAGQPETFSFDRLTTGTDGPYDAFAITTSIGDSDQSKITYFNGSAITPASSVTSSTTSIRYGRLKLGNAFGSELLPLAIPFTAQYWVSGQGWQTNTWDTCTTLSVPTSGNGLTFYTTGATNQLTSANLAARMRDSSGTLISSGTGVFGGGSASLGGNGRLILTGTSSSASGPGAGHYGYVDIAPTVPPYLQFPWAGGANTSPSSRATFGTYKGPPTIYIREIH